MDSCTSDMFHLAFYKRSSVYDFENAATISFVWEITTGQVEGLKVIDHSEKLCVDRAIIQNELKRLGEEDVKLINSAFDKICDGFLWTRWLSFNLHKGRQICCTVKKPPSCQEGPCPIRLILIRFSPGPFSLFVFCVLYCSVTL
jgi:hypothetical protein